jgi:hypothetical protein
MGLRFLLGKLQRGVARLDLFSTTELLRFREDPEFKTFTGGCCSLGLLLGFLLLFTQTVLATFRNETINSQTALEEQSDPASYRTNSAPFLFAVGLTGLDLNHPSLKYFNIEVAQRTQQNRTKSTQTIPLEPCRRQVWTTINSSLGETFDRLQLGQWMCLPDNYSLQF